MSTATRPHGPAGLSALLPGQVHAAPGPVDLRVTWAINHGLRRDLLRFSEAVRRTTVGDRDAWQRLGRRWQLLVDVLDMNVHGQDHGLWPAVRRRDATRDALGVLDAMESEHAALTAQVALIGQLVASLAARPDAGTRAALIVRMAGCRDALLRHLAHEETDAMPLVQAHLTQEEWQGIDREHFLARISPKLLLRLVPWAAHDLPPGVRREVLAAAGPGFRMLWWVTRAGFARREARVFGEP